MARTLTAAGSRVLLGLVAIIPAVWTFHATAGASGASALMSLMQFERAPIAGLFWAFVGLVCGVFVLVGIPVAVITCRPSLPRKTRSVNKVLAVVLLLAIPIALLYTLVLLWSAIPWTTFENWLDAKNAQDPDAIGRNVALMFWGGVGVLIVICMVIAAVQAIFKPPRR
jgi:glucan phosphoethanolaminetransferase (alkaline phosphatase superfamily)